MRRLNIALSLVSLFSLALPALAQTPQPRLGALSPAGARRGTTVEITLTGTQIGTTTGLLFEGEGIGVESIQIPKDRPNTAVAKVRILPNAVTGVRAVRAVTPAGASDRQWFYVGAYPEVAEKEPNNSREQAQVLPSLPVTIVGKSDPGEDIDYYRFRGVVGQTYVMEIVATRLGFPFDSVLSVQDAQGRDLALNDDYFGPDSFLTFTPQKEGDYYIVVRDLRFQGSGNHIYRLTVGAIPFLQSISPLGGAAGKPISLSLFGINLPPNSTQQVTPTPVEGRSKIMLPISLPDGTTVATPFAIGEGYEMQEQEPNDSPKLAHSLRVPVVVNGHIMPAPNSKQPDIDNYSFKTEKGKKWVFEVIAKRLGSRLEPHISILNAQGNEIAVSDDQSTQLDTRLEFTAPDTGTYVVQVRDLFFKGGEEYPYRLSIQEPHSDFRLNYTADRINIGQGGRVALTVNATRMDGYGGDIDLDLRGLPEGVRLLTPAQIPAGRDSVNLVLEAAVEAKVQGLPFTLLGRGGQGKQKRVHEGQAVEVTLTPENNPIGQPREFPAIAVMAGADGVLNASLDRLTLAPGESKEIVLKVARRAGFNAKIPLSLLGAQGGITVSLNPAEIPEKQTEAKLVIKAEANAPLGTFTLIAQGRILVDEPRPYYIASVPILLTIAKK